MRIHKLWFLVCLVFLACGPQWQPDPGPTQPDRQTEVIEAPMSTTYAGSNTFPTAVTIPSDGDTKPAASVNVAFEGLADRTQWLAARVNGNNKFLMTVNSSSGGDPVVTESFVYNTVGTTWTKSAVVLVDIPSCLIGDVLLAKLHVGSTVDGVGSFSFRMRLTNDFGGTNVDADMSGSRGAMQTDSGTSEMFPFGSMGEGIVTVDGAARVVLEIRLSTIAPGTQLDLYSGIYLEVERFRA